MKEIDLETQHLTLRQYTLIALIGSKPTPTLQVRHRLFKAGIDMTGPAFYMAMKRLEKRNFILAIIPEDPKETKSYQTTPRGCQAWDAFGETVRALDVHGMTEFDKTAVAG